MATGVAWTESGGDVLFIEASLMPAGHGQITLTGHLGNVMQESARAAVSQLRSAAAELGLPADLFKKNDLHVHVPAGAIPKDGPSAGVTMATAILSAIRKQPVRSDVAMTGEITLSGAVLPVGGIREKVLAARRYGITTFILPERNAVDIAELPEEVRADMTFVPVRRLTRCWRWPFRRPRRRLRRPTTPRRRHPPRTRAESPGAGGDEPGPVDAARSWRGAAVTERAHAPARPRRVLVFYISGHAFGHASRCIEIINAVLAEDAGRGGRGPDLRREVAVRPHREGPHRISRTGLRHRRDPARQPAS